MSAADSLGTDRAEEGVPRLEQGGGSQVALRAPVGMHDVLWPASRRVMLLTARFASLAERLGYGLVLTPLVEDARLYARGIGEGSEIVRKEMYEFEDRGGRRLALRPEGTASVVRAFVEHRPPVPYKAFYVGPAFRYERPQAGRYRQHHQLGVEAIGSFDPALDVEQIAFAWRFVRSLGLERVRLLVSSMGCRVCRPTYLEALASYLRSHVAELCEEHRSRLEWSPLRVLDCKRDACRRATEGAPRLVDALCEACAAHFAEVRSGLDALGVPYDVDPRLVRGFDYYTRTTFELKALALESAQDAVGGGGRYDDLVETIGGPPTPGVGFALGVERLLLACDAEGCFAPDGSGPDAYVVDLVGGHEATKVLVELADAGLRVQRSYDGRSAKAQLRAADRSKAAVAVILGPRELAEGSVRLRMLADGTERVVARGHLAREVRRGIADGRAAPPPSCPHLVPTGLRTAGCGELRAADVGRRVALCGWVASRRDHGQHLAFLDLRDASGRVQCVVDGSVEARAEWVVRVEGTVRRRPEGTENPELATGEVELTDCNVEVLSRAEPVPFEPNDRLEVEESIRLAYRHIDLRRPRMQTNLRLRARVIEALRRAMLEQGFVEVETPLLWTPTPEGAREFLVPSRLRRGEFYVLPQSPQLAKQLLMAGGMDRYFQLARCFRDEDLRADRQFEFTQLDLEASFVGPEEVQDAVTQAVQAAVVAAFGYEEAVRRGALDVVRLTYAEALARFGTDKPDLRIPGELVDLTAALGTGRIRALEAPYVAGLRVAGGAALGRARLDALVERARALGAEGLAWFRVGGDRDEPSIDSPLARALEAADRQAILERTGAGPGDLVLAIADRFETAVGVLGRLRTECQAPADPNLLRFCWVTDFPLFEGVDEEGRLMAAHHPFTMPHPADFGRLDSDPLSVRALAYDLVVNGWELGSGSVRVHRVELQRRLLGMLGIDAREAEARFGFLLRALAHGAPPHGGFAVGVDRLVAVLAEEDSIREVIAFPKTQSGADPLTGAPKPVPAALLAELGLAAVSEQGARERSSRAMR